jgi:methyl-accepting chemotaxis protein
VGAGAQVTYLRRGIQKWTFGPITVAALAVRLALTFGAPAGALLLVGDVALQQVGALERETTVLRDGDHLDHALDHAPGDLTVEVIPATTPVEVTSTDQLGQLCDTFNGMLAKTQRSVGAYGEMQENLSSLIGEVAGNATTVASASQQMASTSDEAGHAVGAAPAASAL